MKRQFALIAIVTVLIVSCTGFFDMREYEEIVDRSVKDEDGFLLESDTMINFLNIGKKFPVDVFAAPARSVRVNRTLIPADSQSKFPWIPTTPDKPFTFYFTFYLPIEGLDIPFISNTWGSTTKYIKFNDTTEVLVPDLKKIFYDQKIENEFLINNVCVILENNSSHQVTFMRGTASLQPENISSGFLVPTNEKGLYRINPSTTSSGFSVTVNFAPFQLPSEITSFSAGHVYIIEITGGGTPILKESFPLTMSYFQD